MRSHWPVPEVDVTLLLFLQLVIGWVGVETEVNAKLNPPLS